MHDAFKSLDLSFHAWNYPPRAGETWGYNCRRITGGSGWSLHAYGPDSTYTFWTGVTVSRAVAVDINSISNPYGASLVTDMPRNMIEAILAIRTNSGHQLWGWGGNYSGNKDAMHFELLVSPAQLASGINWATVKSVYVPPPVPAPSTVLIIQEVSVATRRCEFKKAPGIDGSGNGMMDTQIPFAQVGSVEVNLGGYNASPPVVIGRGNWNGQCRIYFRGPVNHGPFDVIVESFV